MKVFARKSTAFKFIKPGQILANREIKKYFIVSGYNALSKLVTETDNPCFYEFIPDEKPVKLFFDIEVYRDSEYFKDSDNIVRDIKTKLDELFTRHNLSIVKFIVLQSHLTDQKHSYHIICDIINSDGLNVYFKTVKSVKPVVASLFPELVGRKIIDTSVYREGLFRTYLSSKEGENRPLVKWDGSHDFTVTDTFVANTSVDNCVVVDKHYFKSVLRETTREPEIEEVVPEELEIIEPVQQELTKDDKAIIKKFVHKNYGQKERDIRDIVIDRDRNCIVIALDDLFCFNVDREHKSNHQYIIIDTYSSKQKCHDLDCKDFKHHEIKIDKFPKELNELILKCLKINRQELELIERAIEECKSYITENFDENIEQIEFDKQEMVFRGHATSGSIVKLKGKCPECNIEHQISDTGYCLRCKVCNSIFPKHQLIPVDDRYKNLNKFWMTYNQLVNNGTVNININNFYNREEEFSCDVQLDSGIIKDKKLLKLINECLDGHKITKLAEVMYNIYKNYVYTGNDWYMFDTHKWTLDTKSLNFKRHILELCNLFQKIKQHYENKTIDNDAVGIIKNIKSLITKINKPQLKEDILREAQMFYIDNNFFGKLNSRKHLIPFSNGVYDLLDNNFRKTTKDDYINLTVGFKYDEFMNNSEVYMFINQILPNQGVRDYVLKKMSECLNGDIPNTNFLMFIGDGANGKSQLLNLMKATMGELGEKVEVTLLTRKRNNANEANTEKIKLMNKRFAFLSEPEDGEKINIGLLKELTGSEEIVARGLYQEAMSFVMESKLFLACNELPEIKGEDTALWRRIRVIDFPSRFVDEPKDQNEYKIDRTLHSRMREDTSWKQTFMNILISYYYKDVKEPNEVQLKTNEYRQDNNIIYNWMEENIEFSKGKTVSLKDACSIFFSGKLKIGVKEKGKFRKELEKCIKFKFKTANPECQRTTIDGIPFQGWIDLCLKE